MNPNDIRIRRVYTREKKNPDVVDDSLKSNASKGTYELVVEWEAGRTMNAARPELHLCVATRDIYKNENVKPLTFTDTNVRPDGVDENKKYEYPKEIPEGVFEPDHMYEIAASLIHSGIPLHSFECSWNFAAY